MSVQPTVLQVVIMRDGLLVGTEVFVPGQYTLGSGPGADLCLADPNVEDSHAFLYFQNGRAAIEDGGSGATYVNGNKVTTCELRPVDEVACGPFTLKIRIVSQKPGARAAPASVASLLGGPAPSKPQPPSSAAPPRPPEPSPPERPAPPRPIAVGGSRPQPSATIVSNRRMNAAPRPAEPATARAPHLRSVPVQAQEPSPTVKVQLDADLRTAPLEGQNKGHEATVISRAHHPQKKSPEQKAATPEARVYSPGIPSAADGKGKPVLFVDFYWGDTRRYSNSYRKIDPKTKLVAREDDSAPLPLYGFSLAGAEFVFAEQMAGDLYRVYVPPGAAIERRAADGNFYPVQTETLEKSGDSRRHVTLGTGHAVRFSGAEDVMVMAYVQPPIPKPFVNPLRGLPWLTLAVLALLLSAFGTFLFYFADLPLDADFQSRTINPVAVKLIAPPKPEEKLKLEKKIEKIKKAEKKPEVAKKVEKETPKPVAAETKKVLKTIEKLAAAGPAMKDLLQAVDKLGSGPGSKTAKNDTKLSGLLGKAPIANAGIGTFGLGGGGAGGQGFKGAELLRGKGGAGIGALGAGNIGKSSVAGTVTRASTRSIGAQGTIDKEAVAKVINSHLHEVSSCYERALLKTPGLAGKIVLEWQITTAGAVGYAKTKSSTMQSPAVESCILTSIKGWRFPAAKGSGVVITYPFMFNSVGY